MDHEVESKRSTSESGSPPDVDTLANWFRELAPTQPCPAPQAFQIVANVLFLLWLGPTPKRWPTTPKNPAHNAASALLEAIEGPLQKLRAALEHAQAAQATDAGAVSRKNNEIARRSRALFVVQTIHDLLPEAMAVFDPFANRKPSYPSTPWHLPVWGLASATANAWRTVSNKPLSVRRDGRLVFFVQKLLTILPKPVFQETGAIEQALKRSSEWREWVSANPGSATPLRWGGHN